MRRSALGALGFALLVVSCGSDAPGGTSDQPETSAFAPPTTTATTSPITSAIETGPGTTSVDADECAHVIDGAVTPNGDTFTVSATVRSADTGEDKYADRWEVRTPAGTVLGERVLTHPHVDEQPFTRTLRGVVIPKDVSAVVLAAHDSVVGFCGDVFEAAVER